MIGLWILVVIVVVLLIWLIAAYNGLVMTRQRAQEAYSDIDVQLKRRYDLIPNLVRPCRAMPRTRRRSSRM